MVVRKGGK
jgi:hypothetical protein